MEIIEEKRGDVKVVALRGRLDSNTSPVLEKRIQTILEQGENRLVFDFSELIYISSLGLRVLIMAAKSMQKINGKLSLSGLNGTIYGIFKIAGFTSVFSIYPTLEDAIQHCAN